MTAPTAITDPKQILRLYKSIGGRNAQQKQDLYLIALATGAHASVLANPHRYEAVFEDNILSWRRTKTGKLCRIIVPEAGHYIPVEPGRVRAAVSRWLSNFAQAEGFPGSRKTVDLWFRTLGKKAQYRRPLSPGTFRHTFCYQDLKAHRDFLRTMNKLQCTMRMIQDNYGILGVE